MRPVPFKVARGKSESVKVEHDRLPYFYDSLHVHNDYQLTLILNSFGILYVGNQLLPFRVGDIFLIGKNIPHVFKNDAVVYEDQTEHAEAISLYFQEDFSGVLFESNDDYHLLHEVLSSAAQCMSFRGTILKELTQQLPKFLAFHPLKRIIALMDLLLRISNSEEVKTLSSDAGAEVKISSDMRIRNVFDFIINHHREPINLSEVAEIANMTETSFCRYFKYRTRKTFSRYLAEVRVESACNKLRSGQSIISAICYDSGFQNLSNFNRHFKRITGMSPKQFQKQQLFDFGSRP